MKGTSALEITYHIKYIDNEIKITIIHLIERCYNADAENKKYFAKKAYLNASDIHIHLSFKINKSNVIHTRVYVCVHERGAVRKILQNFVGKAFWSDK